MTVNNEPIIVVCASDNNFVKLAAAMLKSIEINHKTSRPIIVYFLDNGILSWNRRKLSASMKNLTVKWIKIKKNHIKTIHGFDNFSNQSPYTRLLMPYVIPNNIHKIIYLDCDLLVLNDIEELWKTKLNNYTIGTVLDPHVQSFDCSWGGILNYKNLGFNPKTKYFNSGVMLVNLQKWLTEKISERTIKVNTKHDEYVK